MNLLRSGLAGLLLLMLQPAWAQEQQQGPAPVSFSAQVLPLLMRECSYCHMREDRYGYLVIDPESTWSNLVEVPAYAYPQMMRVLPGSADQSYLWKKLTGEHLQLGAEGWLMPYFRWSDQNLELVRRWIEEGALDN